MEQKKQPAKVRKLKDKDSLQQKKQKQLISNLDLGKGLKHPQEQVHSLVQSPVEE